MAIKEITKTNLTLNVGDVVAFTAATSATDGFKLDASGKDGATVYEFYNSGSASGTVNVQKGDGMQAVGDAVTLTLAAGEYGCFACDSGAFKNTSGDNKGSIVAIPSSTDIKARVIVLP